MSSITEAEELGVKIIAMIREGGLDMFKCDKCTPELREQRNCDGNENFETSVFAHPLLDVEMYVCPMLLIPSSVYSWLDEYDYYEKYNSAAPSYKDVNYRFWETTKTYETFKYDLKRYNDKHKPKESEDNMSKMAGLFKKGDNNG